MKQLLFIMIALTWLPTLLIAQQSGDVDGIKKEINAIKLDERYQKEEKQDSDEGLAEEYAFHTLLKSVNISRKEKGLDSLSQKHLRPFVKFLTYPRQTIHKAFAYVLVADVDKFHSGISFGQSSAVTPLPPGPGHQKTPDTIKVGQSGHDSLCVTPAPLFKSPHLTPSMSKSQVLMSLTTMEMATEVFRALEQFKEKNQVSAFAKMNPSSVLRADDYVVVFDQKVVVQSILQPSGDGTYRNILTQSEDSLGNYRGKNCGAIWFRF